MQGIAGPLLGTMWATTELEKQSARFMAKLKKLNIIQMGPWEKTKPVLSLSTLAKILFKFNYPLTINKILKTPKDIVLPSTGNNVYNCSI
nr:hypothetical protein Itr_chr09CG12630 [Ipomoea trifida]